MNGTSNPRHSTRRVMKRFTRVAAAAVSVLALGALASCSDDAPAKAMIGYTLTPPTQVGALTLPNGVSGEPFAFKPAPGHLLITYFGYTSCPDVCPTTMADLKAALNRLGPERAAQIEVTMVTIDPKRDLGPALQDYVRSFVPNATGLRTDDDAALRAVTNAFGAQYSVTGSGDSSEVTHSGSLYVINPAGEIVDVLSFPTPAADIENDLSILLGRL